MSNQDVFDPPGRNSLDDMDQIAAAIKHAKPHGLELEVILWSLYYAQSNPKATISECMDAGLTEWDV